MQNINLKKISPNSFAKILSRFLSDLHGTIESLSTSEPNDHTIIEVGNDSLQNRFHFVSNPQIYAEISRNHEVFSKPDYMSATLGIFSIGRKRAFIASEIFRLLGKKFRTGISLERLCQNVENKAVSLINKLSFYTTNIFSALPTDWIQKKGDYSKIFSASKIRKASQSIADTFSGIIHQWQPNDRISPYKQAHRMTLSYFTKHAFSCDVSESECQMLAQGLNVLNDEIIKRIFDPRNFSSVRYLSPNVQIPSEEKQDALMQLKVWIHNLAENRLNNRIDCHQTTKNKQPDFLDVVIDSTIKKITKNGLITDDTEKDLILRQVKNDILTALLAGGETTAVSITYALYDLAHNQERQARLQEEIDTFLTQSNQDIYKTSQCPVTGFTSNKTSIVNNDKLPILNNLLKETFLKYSPVPIGLPRQVRSDYTTKGGVEFKEGDIVIFRYNKINQTEEINDSPFHYGQHKCCGLNLAKEECAIALFEVFRNYNIRPLNISDTIPEQEKNSFLARPAEDIQLHIQARDHT